MKCVECLRTWTEWTAPCGDGTCSTDCMLQHIRDCAFCQHIVDEARKTELEEKK